MKIKFDSGAEGFYEARELQQMASYFLSHIAGGDERDKFLRSLVGVAEEHMAASEFDVLRKNAVKDGAYQPVTEVNGFSLRNMFSGLLGPTQREMELSRQRIQAQDRAQRAEISSFEALAEMAEIGRQRDQLKLKVKDLENKK